MEFLTAIAYAPEWCNVVHQHESYPMPAADPKSQDTGGYRLSVSLTAQQHEQLAEIAKTNRVSIAWVVREAIERLLQGDMPLFHIRQPR